MLGTLFLTLGLAAAAAATLRADRRERALLWFGVFTALYGARLIARSRVVLETFTVAASSWRVIETVITYGILVPAALLGASAMTKQRRLLRYLWRADLLCAVIAIVW